MSKVNACIFLQIEGKVVLEMYYDLVEQITF